MTALMRNSLKEATKTLSTAHAGLLLNRGLKIGGKEEKEIKNKLIKTVCAVTPCELYKKAFDRWVALTAKPEQFASLSAKIEGRMFIGLATGGAIETGVSTQHSYGMPLLAGSAVKGAVRAYAESVGVDAEYLAVLFGEDEDSVKQGNDEQGSDRRKAGAGCLVWHDAWWYPHDNTQPFVAEVVTVHHQKYYGNDGEASDFDSPIPNQQVAVQGSFYFVIEGDMQWVALAKQLLKNTLEQQGLGAKTAAGYGYFFMDEKAEKAAKQKAKDQEADKLPPNQKLMHSLRERLATDTASKNRQLAAPMGNELRAIIDQCADWPKDDCDQLRELTTKVFAHLGVDRKRSDAAKKLWQKIPA